jgi:hypothetical protein
MNVHQFDALREWRFALQDEEWVETNTVHQWLCQGTPAFCERFTRLQDVLRLYSWRAMGQVSR